MTFKTSSKKTVEIAAASKQEEHLMSGITHPGLHDCLCGRGGHATNHPGNVQFRALVSQYKDYYMGLSRYGKLQVAAEVVKLWRSQTPQGRFLAMTDPTRRDTTTWYDIGDKEAIKKTSQCLRERIPPNQKARTLDLTSKKKNKRFPSHPQQQVQEDLGQRAAEQTIKQQQQLVAKASVLAAARCPNAARVQQQQQQQSQPSSSQNVTITDLDWDEVRTQLLLPNDCQPTPVSELAAAATTSSSSPFSSHSSSSFHRMGSGSSTTSSLTTASSVSMTPLQYDVPAPQQSTAAAPMPPPPQQHNRFLSTSSISSNFFEDFYLQEEKAPTNAAMVQELQQQQPSSTRYSSSNSEPMTNGIDTSLIPSAANLTMNVFDEEDNQTTGSTATVVTENVDLYKPIPVMVPSNDGNKAGNHVAPATGPTSFPRMPSLNESLAVGTLFSN